MATEKPHTLKMRVEFEVEVGIDDDTSAQDVAAFMRDTLAEGGIAPKTTTVTNWTIHSGDSLSFTGTIG